MGNRTHNPSLQAATAALLLATWLLFGASLAQAQAPRSADASSQVARQLQELATARARLQQENEVTRKELEDLKAKLAQVTADRNRLDQRAKGLESASARQQEADKAATESLERSRSQLQELVAKFKETALTLQAVESDRDQIKGRLEAMERELKICTDRNAGMYLLNDEVLRRLEDRGFWQVLKDKEAFTRLSRTRLENLVDGYRDRAEELRLRKNQQADSATTR